MRTGPHSQRGACFRTRTSKCVLQQFMPVYLVLQHSFSIHPIWVQFSNPDPIHDHHYIWNPLVATTGSTLSASSCFLSASSLFPSKWGRTLQLSFEAGMSDLEGKTEAGFCLFVLMVEPRRPDPFDGAKSAHAQKQAYYHVFSRSWKILQTAAVDLEHRCSCGSTDMFLFATSQNILKSSPDLILTCLTTD